MIEAMFVGDLLARAMVGARCARKGGVFMRVVLSVGEDDKQ
jgi:hypothetical protein